MKDIEIKKMSQYKYNSGVFKHNKDFHDFMNHQIENILSILGNECTIVSIGSGNGVFEKELEKKFNIKIICIDPDETLFLEGDTFKKPQYMNVQSYIASEEYDEKKPIFMIINWPFFDDWLNQNPVESDVFDINDQNNIDYDIFAIQELQPDAMLLHYAPCGAAGSTRLISFLNKTKETDFTHFCMEPYESVDLKDKTLTLTSVFADVQGSGFDFTGSTNIISTYMNKNLINNPYECKYKVKYQKQKDCNLM